MDEIHREVIAHVLSCQICIAELAKIEDFIQKSKAGSTKSEKKIAAARHANTFTQGRPLIHDPNCERRIAQEEATRNPAIPKFHYRSVNCTCGKGYAVTWRQRHGKD